MPQKKIKKIKKRSGLIVAFNPDKIVQAVYKAMVAIDKPNKKLAEKLGKQVVKLLLSRLDKKKIPTVEQVQDIVEEVLIDRGDYIDLAKAYILYREQHRHLRDTQLKIDIIDEYLKKSDWMVKENSNMAYSLQGLNSHITSKVTARYWLEKIYPKEIRRAYQIGDFHIHDLGILSVYCVGWSLEDLLLKGFGGVFGKVSSKPPKHLRTALGQAVNFIYTLQGESAGAQAFSDFDVLLAPFVRYDNLKYSDVKQCLQEFLFNLNIPTRVGFQAPFSNLTMDLVVPKTLANQHVIIGGERMPEKYKDFQEEVDMLNQAFAELMIKGDASGRVFTFPIPTYNITSDFDWDNEKLNPIWKMTAKYGIPYFANFVNSDMKVEDARSMCCRLRLDNTQLYKRGGGLFGAGALTGSIGVVTINLPRLGYKAKNKTDFMRKLGKLMKIASNSLEIKRKVLERYTSYGLYPYTKHYLQDVKKGRGSYWANHFSTIGLVGMNECLLNLINKDIVSEEGHDLAGEILDFMNKKLIGYQKETGNFYNLEATPAEGCSYSLARKDKKKYPDIKTAGQKEPYYTNSTHLPVGYSDDIFDVLQKQDDLQTKYTGGTVVHVFLGEQISDIGTTKKLVRKIAQKFHLPYFSLTPTFSVCPVHGYLSGKHFTCPKCIIKQPCEVYSRVVGYLRPVQQWHKGKSEEFRQRKEFKIKKSQL